MWRVPVKSNWLGPGCLVLRTNTRENPRGKNKVMTPPREGLEDRGRSHNRSRKKKNYKSFYLPTDIEETRLVQMTRQKTIYTIGLS
jgi:hypothetical protein